MNSEMQRGFRLIEGVIATTTTVAARLGVQKETLSRMLRGLSERGCIRVEGRVITILDRTRLSGLAA